GALAPDGTRKIDAAVVDVAFKRQMNAFAGARQDRKHAEIPEEDDQQRRDVAEQFDIDHADLAHQPIVREPADTDDEADDGGGNDARRRDDERIEKADEDGAAISRIRGIGDRAFGDVET